MHERVSLSVYELDQMSTDFLSGALWPTQFFDALSRSVLFVLAKGSKPLTHGGTPVDRSTSETESTARIYCWYDDSDARKMQYQPVFGGASVISQNGEDFFFGYHGYEIVLNPGSDREVVMKPALVRAMMLRIRSSRELPGIDDRISPELRPDRFLAGVLEGEFGETPKVSWLVDALLGATLYIPLEADEPSAATFEMWDAFGKPSVMRVVASTDPKLGRDLAREKTGYARVMARGNGVFAIREALRVGATQLRIDTGIRHRDFTQKDLRRLASFVNQAETSKVMRLPLEWVDELSPPDQPRISDDERRQTLLREEVYYLAAYAPTVRKVNGKLEVSGAGMVYVVNTRGEDHLAVWHSLEAADRYRRVHRLENRKVIAKVGSELAAFRYPLIVSYRGAAEFEIPVESDGS